MLSSTIRMPPLTRLQGSRNGSQHITTPMMVVQPLVPVCEQYNATFIRDIIPDLYNEMHTNTAIGAIFDAYAPNGVDTTKFGRIVTVNFKSNTFSTHQQMMSKIPVMYGRNITINDDLVLKVRVLREVVDYVPMDRYRVGIQLVDLNVKNCRYLKRWLEVSRLLTDFTRYNTGDDFRRYLLDSVQAFNYQQYITDFLGERKEFYNKFKVIGSRF